MPHKILTLNGDKALQLLHGSNISGLDVLLDLLNLLLKIGHRDLLVLNDQGDLELANAETDGDQRGSTPKQTILLDGADGLLEGLHVGLVI